MANNVNDYVSVDVVNIKLTPLMYKKERKATATLVTPKEVKRPKKPVLHYDQFIRPEFRSPEQSARSILSDDSSLREKSWRDSDVNIDPVSIYSSDPSPMQSLSAPTRSVLTPTLSERSSVKNKDLMKSPVRSKAKRCPFRYRTSTPNKKVVNARLWDSNEVMESPIIHRNRNRSVASKLVDKSAFQKCSLIRAKPAKTPRSKDTLDPRVWRRVEYGGVHLGSSEVSYSDDGRRVYKTLSTPTSGGAGNASITVVSTQLDSNDISASKYSEPQANLQASKRQLICGHNLEPYCCTEPCHDARVAYDNAYCPTETAHIARSVVPEAVKVKSSKSTNWTIKLPSAKFMATIIIGLQFVALLVYRFLIYRTDSFINAQ